MASVGELAAAPMRQTLTGGLRVVLHSVATQSQVSVAVSYLAGEVDDPRGKRGVHRLVEAMMFAGSASVKDGQHRKLVRAAGGNVDVVRTPEITTFVTSVPPARLALALWLEAERMASLTMPGVAVVRARKRLVAIRDAEPSRVADIVERPLLSLALQGSFGFQSHPLADLELLTPADVRSFHGARYTTARSVLVVVGPIDITATSKTIKKYYGGILRGGKGAARPTVLASQQTRRSSTMRSKRSQYGSLAMAWAAAGRSWSQWAALEVAGDMLATRLRASLARGKSPALAVGARMTALRHASVLRLWTQVPRGTAPGQLTAACDSELRWLAAAHRGKEAKAASKRVLTRWRQRLQRQADHAHLLGVHELLDSDAGQLEQRVKAVTNLDTKLVHSLAKKWLLPHRTSIIELDPLPIIADEGDKP